MMDPPCPRGTLAPLHTVGEWQTSSLRTKGPSQGEDRRGYRRAWGDLVGPGLAITLDQHDPQS